MRDGDRPAESRRSRSPDRRESGGQNEGGGRGRYVVLNTPSLAHSLTPSSVYSNDGGANPGNNLHVSGLSHKVDNRELESVFSKFGKVSSLVQSFASHKFNLSLQVDRAAIMFDPHTRDSRGFGFVTMETAEGAEAAIAALNGTDLMGKNLIIEKVCQKGLWDRLKLTFIHRLVVGVLVLRPQVVTLAPLSVADVST